MEATGNSATETTSAFLRQLRRIHPQPLVVIWDNGSASGGEAVRGYFAIPDLKLRLAAFPANNPDFNPDEAISQPGYVVSTLGLV